MLLMPRAAPMHAIALSRRAVSAAMEKAPRHFDFRSLRHTSHGGGQYTPRAFSMMGAECHAGCAILMPRHWYLSLPLGLIISDQTLDIGYRHHFHDDIYRLPVWILAAKIASMRHCNRHSHAAHSDAPSLLLSYMPAPAGRTPCRERLLGTIPPMSTSARRLLLRRCALLVEGPIRVVSASRAGRAKRPRFRHADDSIALGQRRLCARNGRRGDGRRAGRAAAASASRLQASASKPGARKCRISLYFRPLSHTGAFTRDARQPPSSLL